MKSSKLFFAILTLLLTFNAGCFRKVVVDNSAGDVDPDQIERPRSIVKITLQNLESDGCYQGLPQATKDTVQKVIGSSPDSVIFDQLPAGEYSLVSDQLYTAQFLVDDTLVVTRQTALSIAQAEILPDQKFVPISKECERINSTQEVYMSEPSVLPARFEVGRNSFSWLETRKISILFHESYAALGSRYLENAASSSLWFVNGIIVRKVTEAEFEIYKIENYGSTHYPSFKVWVGHYVRTSTP